MATFKEIFRQSFQEIFADFGEIIHPIFSISPYQTITTSGGGFTSNGFAADGSYEYTDTLAANNALSGFRYDSGWVDYLGNGEPISERKVINGVAEYRDYGRASLDVGMCTGDSFSNAPGEYAQTIEGLHPFTNISVDGVSGETLAQIAARFSTDLDNADPQYVIIQGGINDIAASRSVADMKTDMLSMINEANSRNLAVYVMNIGPAKNWVGWSAPRQADIEEYNTWLATQDATLIDIYDMLGDPGDATALNSAYDSGDGLHPNIIGFGVMGDDVADKLLASSFRAYRGIECVPSYTSYEVQPFFCTDPVGTKASTSLGATNITGFTANWADPYFAEVVNDATALAEIGFDPSGAVIEVDNTSGGWLYMNSNKTNTPASPHLAIYARVLTDGGTAPTLGTHLGAGTVAYSNTSYRRIETLATGGAALSRLQVGTPPGSKIRFFGAEITDFISPPIAVKTAQVAITGTIHSTALTLTTPLSGIINFIPRVSQTAVIFHNESDATNYLQIRVTPTQVIIAKSVAGSETTATVSHTHTENVSSNIRFRVNEDNTTNIWVDGTGKQTDSNTDAIVYGATTYLGSDGTTSCNGIISTTIYDEQLDDAKLLSL